MGAKCRSPRPLGSRLGKQGCPSQRQRISFTPSFSLMNTSDGILGASLPHHPAQHVLTCLWGRTERGREVHPLKPMANPTPAGSQDNHTHHATGGLLDLSEGNLGPVPWGIPTKEAAQLLPCRPQLRRRSYPGHLVLTDELFAEVGVPSCQKRTNVGWPPSAIGQSTTQKPSPGPTREEAHMTRPYGRPGEPTSRHWKLPTY